MQKNTKDCVIPEKVLYILNAYIASMYLPYVDWEVERKREDDRRMREEKRNAEISSKVKELQSIDSAELSDLLRRHFENQSKESRLQLGYWASAFVALGSAPFVPAIYQYITSVEIPPAVQIPVTIIAQLPLYGLMAMESWMRRNGILNPKGAFEGERDDIKNEALIRLCAQRNGIDTSKVKSYVSDTATI